jgi:hypothetical protein
MARALCQIPANPLGVLQSSRRDWSTTGRPRDITLIGLDELDLLSATDNRRL